MLAINYNTNDKTIRKVLIRKLEKTYSSSKNTRIIPEFNLSYTGTRADIAVINGVLHGYELKGDLDSLTRLSRQIDGYNSIFDKITIVVGKKHLVNTIREIPDWWGVILAKNIGNRNNPSLIEVRKASQNLTQNTSTILNLLWKNEIVGILKKEQIYKNLASASKNELCEVLVSNLEVNKIKTYVRNYLVNRKGMS